MTTTKQTMFYFSMKRSGSHAIIHFIFRLYDEPKAFFAAQVPRRMVKPHKYWTDPDSKCIVPEGFYEAEDRELSIISYEDPKMNSKLQGSWDAEHGLLPNDDYILGMSEKIIPILSIRDPFNMFASRFRDSHYVERKNTKKREHFKNMWKDHAKEYLGHTSVLPSNTVKINFNKWFSDINYRMWLADAIGKPFNEEGWNIVTKEGKGSSFDRRQFENNADQMNLLSRWKKMRKDLAYRSIFKDKELIRLSEEIFGHIPGTEILYK